ncbi:MAG: hypothetical protein NT106_05000 [Candidatus Sumerlaeota bacterium]|nr:hypothetical protein [Candidatus Sumerlaeota bacterium]
MLVSILSAVVVLFLTQGIFAQEQTPNQPPNRPGGRWDPAQAFDRMDTNKDSKISKDEFRGPADQFTGADTNKDGFLSKDEFEKMPRPQRPDNQAGPGGNQDRFLDRIKENLGSTDEEWNAIKPLISKVNDVRMRGRMGFGGGGGRRGGDTTANANPTADALSKALDSKASADEIKLKLTAYRDQQKKNEEELKKAREELRKVLTINQEARLVLMGVLD